MRENQKRLSLAMDGTTYKRLRQAGVDDDRTNQEMMHDALIQWLDKRDDESGA